MRRCALPIVEPTIPDSRMLSCGDAYHASVAVLSMMFVIGECSNGSDRACINNPSLVQY
jgi:hypothetical protein